MTDTDTEISKDPGGGGGDVCEDEEDPNNMSEQLADDTGTGGGLSIIFDNSNYVTGEMLEHVRKQLEEKHEEEISSLKGSFDLHMEERRENEKRLKTCIETLMTEVVRLEEKIGEIGKRVLISDDGGTQPLDLLQVKMEDVEEGEDGGDHFQDLSYRTEDGSTSGAPPKSSNLLQDDSDSNDDLDEIDKTQEEANNNPGENGSGATHGKADGVGTFLPFMCLCGLEFDSDNFLSDHITEEEQEEQMNKEEAEANLDLNLDPSQFHTDWAIPQIQVGNVMSIKPSSTAAAPRIRNRPRKKAGPSTQHDCHPSRPMHCLCGRVFRTQRKLYRHVQYFTKEKDCSCLLCGKEFAYASHLKSHMLKSHKLPAKGPAAPATKIGKINSKTKVMAAPSYNVPSQPQPYPILGTTLQKAKPPPKLPTPKKASWHRYNGQSHGPSPSHPLHCLCGLQCRDNSTLLKHIKYFTEIKKKALICKLCDQRYPYASQLNAHIARVHGHSRKAVTSTSTSTNGHLEDFEESRPSSMATTSGYTLTLSESYPVKVKVKSLPNQKSKPTPKKIDIKPPTNTPNPGPVPELGNIHAINPSRPLHCMCGSKYGDKEKLWKHVNYFNVYKKSCQLCGLVCPSTSKLTAHIANVHGGNTNANGHGQKATLTPSSSSVRTKTSTLKSPRKPSPRSRPSSSSSIQHGMGEETTNMEGKPQYTCKCGRSCVSIAALHFHIRMASSGKLQQCHLCPEGSKQYSLIALKYHMRSKHNVD